MDFGLSDEQRLLQDTFRNYLADHVPITRVRKIATGDGTDVRALWSSLAELGAAGILIPEEHGGSGLGHLDAALVAEELGRAVTPAPFVASAVLAPVALREAGTPEQQKEWLPKLATGDVLVAAALTECYSRREGAEVRLEGGKLVGKALMVLGLPGADLALIAAGADDLALVATDAPGVEVEALSTIDRTRRLAELRLESVEPAALLGGPGGAARALDRVLDAGHAVLAADTLGACQSMLDQAVEYAKQRSQFGRVIASFQAVKHMCAEMAAELEPARSLVWYAAHAIETVPEDAAVAVAHAKAHMAEVGENLADLATQVHGGIGFTDDQNLHFWFKRIGLNRQLLGGPGVLRERAAQLQGYTTAGQA